jgi:hypothetical protein
VTGFTASASQWPDWLVPATQTTTTTPVLAVATATEPAGYVLAAPAGANGVMEPRLLVASDLPAATATTQGAVTNIPNFTFTTAATAVAANTCSAAVQVAATGVSTSSAFWISGAADTSGVTGWGATGGLVIAPWPTAGYFNYKICNQTSAAITPGAVTFNVGVR